jgi:hypothetical protein
MRASVIERYKQRRAARAVEHSHPALEVGVVGSGGEVMLIRIVAVAPGEKLLNDTVRF